MREDGTLCKEWYETEVEAEVSKSLLGGFNAHKITVIEATYETKD